MDAAEELLMRVTGGRLAGRTLRAPREGVRPTADRAREALFARLDPEGARVLDLYAGSGALGIEALSRGAASVVFVERARRPAAVLRGNLAALGIEADVEVVVAAALATIPRLAREGRRFDLVLADPPYASDEGERALVALARSELLPEQAMVVLESSRRRPPPAVEGLVWVDERRYGEALITRFQRVTTSAARRSTRG